MADGTTAGTELERVFTRVGFLLCIGDTGVFWGIIADIGDRGDVVLGMLVSSWCIWLATVEAVVM